MTLAEKLCNTPSPHAELCNLTNENGIISIVAQHNGKRQVYSTIVGNLVYVDCSQVPRYQFHHEFIKIFDRNTVSFDDGYTVHGHNTQVFRDHAQGMFIIPDSVELSHCNTNPKSRNIPMAQLDSTPF